MSGTGSIKSTSDMVNMDALVRSIDELPSIPETLIQILKILDDPGSSAQDLADVVRLDAPLMAKIIRLANSPYYTGGRELSDIQSCVAVLGFKTVRQVAICVSIASGLVSKCSKIHCRVDYKELWRHSVIAAVITKHYGILMGDEEPEDLFTAGLLHDLGKFVILLKTPELYDRVIANRQKEGRALIDVEVEMLGFDHTMAGEVFGRSWRFPHLLTHCARWHHERPKMGIGATREDRTASIVGLADYVAHTLEPVKSDLGFDAKFVDVRQLYKAVGLDSAKIESNEAACREAIKNTSAFMDLA
jgi:HD-like signal output (HDOD) protein